MYYILKMNKTGKKDVSYLIEVVYKDIDRYSKVPILWDTSGMHIVIMSVEIQCLLRINPDISENRMILMYQFEFKTFYFFEGC